jgi:hypothetical protein
MKILSRAILNYFHIRKLLASEGQRLKKKHGNHLSLDQFQLRGLPTSVCYLAAVAR